MEEEKPSRRLSRSFLFLLRDIGIAFLIVAILLGSIFAYTRVWPPMVVVESSSMQHSNDESFIGVIDTGDLVLVQTAPKVEDITTYIEGRATGYLTYGDFGDVIIFKRLGSETETPIIHRAIAWLRWNDTVNGFDVPSLDNPNLVKGVDWTSTKERPYGLTSADSFTIFNMGFKGVNITFTMNFFVSLAQTSPLDGYITMGDNNAAQGGRYDTWLVKHEWIIGRARGEFPWFGLIKLTFFPSKPNGGCPRYWGDPCAPPNSWTSLTISLIILIAAPIALDLTMTLLSRRRKAAKSEEGSTEAEIEEQDASTEAQESKKGD